MTEDRRLVGLRIKAFNAPLRKARVASGHSIKSLADALEWPYSRMLEIENLNRWPAEEHQMTLAVYLGVPADVLFPAELQEVTGSPTTIELAVTIQAAAALGRQAAIDASDPFLLLEGEWRQEAIKDALETLRPRERDILIKRYGLDGNDPETLREVGEDLGVTASRARQIEAKALRKMRHPTRSRNLRAEPWLPPTPTSDEAAYWQEREREREKERRGNR